MNIDKREANALIYAMTDLVNSVDTTISKLPPKLGKSMHNAKLTLLNVDVNNEKKQDDKRLA
tara:strand:- start:1026 stop:1211 length:186 start_codon:yes stop_codon:yes gene_type:complete